MDYGHGDDLYKFKTQIKANFSSNVWYKGPPTSLLSFIKTRLSSVESYPAPSAELLIKKIALHHHLDNDTIIVTNGATEAFYLIAHAFQKGKVTLCTPSFSEYELASKVHGLDQEFISRKNILTHSFTSDIAFICNPNNPDGYENTPEEISTLLQKHPTTIFIIDEAYVDFTSSELSCSSFLNLHENLIIVKSLTKLFCIPGLRLGYILASPNIIRSIKKYKMPWNVNTLALQAGSFIFDNFNNTKPVFEEYFKNVTKLKQQINAIEGFHVIPSKTSYFLIKIANPVSSALKSYLINNHHILIRDASNFPSLDKHYIRVSCQTPEKNQLLINALKQWKNSL